MIFTVFCLVIKCSTAWSVFTNPLAMLHCFCLFILTLLFCYLPLFVLISISLLASVNPTELKNRGTPFFSVLPWTLSLSVGIPWRNHTQVYWDLIDSSEPHQKRSVSVLCASPEVWAEVLKWNRRFWSRASRRTLSITKNFHFWHTVWERKHCSLLYLLLF